MSKERDNETFARLVQAHLKAQGHRIAVDGWAGRATRRAWDREMDTSNPWPADTEEALTDFYGPRGSNLVLMQLPYPMRLAWDHGTVVTRTRCNSRVSQSLGKVLQSILDHYGLDEIQRLGLDLFGGVVRVRRMRGNSRRWSRHSWGCAIDLDPLHNRLSYPWPQRATMPEKVIELFEAEGWKSYARARGNDAMHFQATR